jgi:uncharacterized protein (TIGR02996 family)
MTSDRDNLLTALAMDEDDTLARLALADLLDELGEHEEAERHRDWPAAKAWMLEFADPDDVEDNDFHPAFTYERLIEYGKEAAASKEWSWSCNANEDMADKLNRHKKEFWRNWSILTGVAVPEEVLAGERGYFSCGC